MKNIRCGTCTALLFKAGRAFAGDLEIKCRRCGTINHMRPAEPEHDRLKQQERQRKTASHDEAQGR
ncbi:Com family DNA-binding transcriptional regulator [Allorhizobium sonneratiae]|uniref:Com family DNA-binding transcriptional regulator n=1 Tax=Allorhizobium sonneratiae TaxID=2934936 RepID=UPI003B84971B